MNIHEVFGPLSEVRYQDALPPAFSEFRKKYLKLARAKQLHGCYIQFTNHADNTMDRTAYASPDHSDPVGVYAYPIDYVLSHPADVWYGSNARFMRVIQSTAKQPLILSHVEDQRTAERLLSKAGFTADQIVTSFQLITKTMKARIAGANRWAKTFMAAVQHDLLSDPVEHEQPGMFSKGGPVFRERTGVEQTALLRRMGFDAVEDRAKSAAAAILNEREPEQIVFLTRAAFRVKEVYNLRQGSGPMGKTDPEHPRTERPLVASIARIMGDVLSEGPERTDMGGFSAYWTKAGRRIEIMFDIPMSYYDNRKFLQKTHRQSKLNTPHQTKIVISSEIGTLKLTYADDKPFPDILTSIRVAWMELTAAPRPTGYVLQNKAGYQRDVQAASDAHAQKQIDKETAQQRAEWPELAETIASVAHTLGLPFDPTAGGGDSYMLGREIDFFRGSLPSRWNKPATREDIREMLDFMVEHVFDAPRLSPLRPAWSQIAALVWALYDRLGAEAFSREVVSRRDMFAAAAEALLKNQPSTSHDG